MQSVALPGFLESLGPLVEHHGYVAVGGLVFLEDFGVPVPGETVLITAAIYAGAGRLNIVAVALVALFAAVVGDNVGYLIGRLGGHLLLERFGRYVLLTPERLERAEAFIDRQGAKIIIVARFIEGLRQANGIVAGASEMPWRRFLTFNAIGAVAWVALWTAVGDAAGSHVGAIYRAVGAALPFVLAAIVLAVVVVVLRRRRRRRPAASKRPARPPADAGDR